ncbi:MAG: hypothetical protein IJW59_01010 [Clostridia bacterium]|nr:hypothetical protein [Clostridia bacterium]
MGNKIEKLTEIEKKAVILALSRMYSDIFSLSRMQLRKLKNQSLYMIETNDEEFSATLSFEDGADSSKILSDMCGIIIDEKYYEELPQFIKDKDNKEISEPTFLINKVIHAIKNPTKEFIGPTGDERIDTGLNPSTILFNNTFIGASQLNQFIQDANIINGEYKTLEIAFHILQKCYNSRTPIANLPAELKEMNSFVNEYFLPKNTNWRKSPPQSTTDEQTEKLKAKLLTIALACDKFFISLDNNPAFDNELCINYTHQKSHRAEREYFHTRETSANDTKRFQHNLFKQINKADIIYWLFGKNNKFLTKQKEQAILKELSPHTTLKELLEYLIAKGILQTANIKENTTILNALILNFATLEGIRLGEGGFSHNIDKLNTLSKKERSKLLSQIFDNNYELAKTNQKLVSEAVKRINQPEHQR